MTQQRATTEFDSTIESYWEKIWSSSSVVFVHATTLEEAQYKLKLATRTTGTAYKHCIAFQIHSTGKGLTNSPMILTFISCTLFDCHAEKAYTMVITNPRGDIFVQLNIIGFVDDSTSIISGDGNNTVESLLEKVKHDAQL